MDWLYELLDAAGLPLGTATAMVTEFQWDADLGYRARCGIECAHLVLREVPLLPGLAAVRAYRPDVTLVGIASGEHADEHRKLPEGVLLKAGTTEVFVDDVADHDPIEGQAVVAGRFLTATFAVRLPPPELPVARDLFRALEAAIAAGGRSVGPRIHFVMKAEHHTYIEARRIDDVGELDLALHYGDDMVAWHDKVVAVLSQQHAGLVLMHGPPGTGKTSYLRFLARAVAAEKRLIFVPRSILSVLGGPEFTAFLVRVLPERESVLVLEDAESVLARRVGDTETSALTSLLLNLTDGILNDVCKCQVVATFNIAIDQVDPALLRAGRLQAVREFQALPAPAARRLAQHLGRDPDAIRGPTSLAEVFALGSGDAGPTLAVRRMGFGSG